PNTDVRCDDGEQTILIWSVCVKVGGNALPVDDWLTAGETSFADERQQNRVMQALIAGGEATLSKTRNIPKRVKIPNEIKKRLLAGDYISDER
ncbi:MAG: hypothetical protein AAFV59_16950, partial [Pseudomonadota bacterium]